MEDLKQHESDQEFLDVIAKVNNIKREHYEFGRLLTLLNTKIMREILVELVSHDELYLSSILGPLESVRE